MDKIPIHRMRGFIIFVSLDESEEQIIEIHYRIISSSQDSNVRQGENCSLVLGGKGQ